MTLTTEQKAAIKAQAKALGINVVGKSLEKIQALIAEKTPSIDPKLAHVLDMANTLGIVIHPEATYDEVVFAIADLKGWANEPNEVIEFLINGGSIEEVPGFVGIAPKPNSRETSAGGKVEPAAPKKTPRKLGKASSEPKPAKTPGAKKSIDPNATSITIQCICAELGVEDRIARRKLRTSDIPKPALGWYWEAGHADIQRVKDLLTK